MGNLRLIDVDELDKMIEECSGNIHRIENINAEKISWYEEAKRELETLNKIKSMCMSNPSGASII